jgi:hypothetical protein
MNKLTTLILVLTTIVITSCNQTVIEGQVFDGFRKPVKDATIKIEGTRFTSQTDGNGKYSVEYVPGNIKVLISKTGYTDTTFRVNISAESTFPAKAVTIYEIPKEDKVFFMHDAKYISLTTGSIKSKEYKIRGGDIRHRRKKIYSITYDVTKLVEVQKSENLLFFDHDPRPLTLFQIQDANNTGTGVILERKIGNYNFGGSDQDRGIKPKVKYISLNGEHCGLRKYNLDKGNYLIVNYQKKQGYNAFKGDALVFRVVD